MKQAFAGPDLQTEFETMKRDVVDKELEIDSKKAEVLSKGEHCDLIFHLEGNYSVYVRAMMRVCVVCIE